MLWACRQLMMAPDICLLHIILKLYTYIYIYIYIYMDKASFVIHIAHCNMFLRFPEISPHGRGAPAVARGDFEDLIAGPLL